MRITGYRCVRTHRDWGRPIGDVNGVVASGITEVPIVIIETDEGVEGVGIGSDADLDRLFPAIEGRDPRATTTLYDAMLAQVFKTGHGGATFGGIGTFDSALWDIKAKLAGEPLWRLLGGGDRWIPGYASGLDIALDDEELAAFYSTMAGRGYRAGKLKGGRDSGDDIRRLTVIADALATVDPHPDLMLDANESWQLKQAVRHVRAVEEKIDLAWIEEPLRRWDAVGHGRLSTAVRAAVATGENLTGLEQYRSLFDHRGVDIAQAGAIWGITHFLRVGHAALARDLPVSPVGLTANPAVAHAAAALPNHHSAEVQDLGLPLGVEVDEEIADGGIVLGDRPGNGISIDPVAIAAATNTDDHRPDAGPTRDHPGANGTAAARPSDKAPHITHLTGPSVG